MTEIKVGQHWKENDPRTDRVVEVLEVNGKAVRIRKVGISGKGSVASAARFNGKRGGYSLVKDGP